MTTLLLIFLAASVFMNVLVVRRALQITTAYLGCVELLRDTIEASGSALDAVGRILRLPLAANDSNVVRIHKELATVHKRVSDVMETLRTALPAAEEEDKPND